MTPSHFARTQDPVRALSPRSWVRGGLSMALVATISVSTIGMAQAVAPSTPHVNEGQSSSEPTVVAMDSMDGQSEAGWGEARVGGAYVHTGASDFSTGSGYGKVVLPSGGSQRRAALPEAIATDTRASLDVAMAALPANGAGIYHSLHLREANGYSYRATLRVTPAGEARLAIARVDGKPGSLTGMTQEVVLPNVVRPHQWQTLSFDVSGTSDSVSLRAKAWPRGGAEPGWQLTAADSSPSRLTSAGSISLTTYASSSGPGTEVFYDALNVVTEPASAPPPFIRPAPPVMPAPIRPVPIPPTPVPPAPQPPPVEPDPGLPVGSSGALPVGHASYPIPSGALFVAPSGSDNNNGSESNPLRTVETAIQRASNGDTIVLRAGTYHQRLSVTKRVTLQNYPGEAVWFDGSESVTGWVQDGGVWRKDGWTAQFDNTPSFNRGSSAGGFLNPAYPMAAHPDQVWVDGVALTQVGSRSQVQNGTFYVDYSTERLYIGTNPAGRSVRGSTIGRAMEVRAEGSVLRGFGVRRYAPSVPDMGTVTIERPNVRVENVHLTDNSTVGISLLAADIHASNLTVARNGLLGVHGNHSDRLKMSHILAAENNAENFNQAPVSGGIKITRAREVSVNLSTMRDNIGPGYWLDESVYDGKVTNSLIHNNVGHGISLEISALMTVAGNVIRDNGRFGIKINNTSDVDVWNNTVVRNNRPINIVQDNRRGDDPSVPGHDPRRPIPDPTMPWINGPVNVHNNVLDTSSGNCLLCVEDYSGEFSAEQMGVTANGNVYQRASASSPQWLTIWSRGAGNPTVHTTLGAFRSATGQEARSLYLQGTAAATAEGRVTAPVRAEASTVSLSIPSRIAQLLGVPVGSRMLGGGLQ